jgi:hypothetical protein
MLDNFLEYSKFNLSISLTRTGSVVSGVYSNADLSANLAGPFFYRNIFEEIEINNKKSPAMISIDDQGYFTANEVLLDNKKLLMKKYISQHFNEALNPSKYEWAQRVIIKKSVKNRCTQWLDLYPNKNKKYYDQLADSLTTWNGIDYGHNPSNLLKISDICY